MKPERWQQVDQLFQAALERAPEERTAFVSAACGVDDSLRREVEALLAADGAAESFIEAPAYAVAAPLLVGGEHDASLVGQHLGHYRIVARLGKGGMGEVYRATDTHLHREVALKVLPADFAQDADRLRRFAQEARAASALNHPNIITIHEIGEAAGTHYIVTEYVAGETLRQRLAGAPQQKLEPQEAVELATQIAAALTAAHAAGIAHRDIKPENVMLRPDGLVKVLDFGLAKLTEGRAPTVDSQAATVAKLSTETGIVLGTVNYMSPEQARGQKVDHRTDIFSLGVMLYEMLAGQRPFAGATASEIIAAVLRDEPPPLSAQLPNCPVRLEQLVTQCLAKSPAQRWQSAAELSAELKATRVALEEDSRPSGAAAEAETQAVSRRAEQASSPWRRWAVSAGVIALIALCVSLYFFRSGRDTAEAAIKTLAVLPPRPHQIGGRDEALELGITSTLITRLGSLRQLIVRPESAVEKYSRPEQDPLAAGREQKVDAVLDSRYQRSGDKLRFRLRLLRVADGATLWADTLDLQTADPFAIEDALSAKVTGALRLTLSNADKELLAKRYTKNAEAWQLYVRGRQLVHTRQVTNIEKAITYLERAIALDQEFALAHVTLGFAYASLHYVGNSPAKEVAPKAKAAYDRALKLDNQLAEAHTFLAEYKQYYEWDFVGAEQLHRRAIDLNPNSADVHHFYALFLMMLRGRSEQAILEIRRAEELDPADALILRNSAQVFFFARRYDEAIEQLRRAIELNRNSPIFYDWMIRAYEMKSDAQAAFTACLRQAEIRGAGADEIAKLRTAFAAEGAKGYLRIQLDRLLEREKNSYVAQYNIALHYARLGEKEQALARLQRALEDRNTYVTALNVEPLWDSYRADPRFVALVRRVGLAP
jgi:eukaryotic-like serine/threonine-protein kinase